MILIPFREIDEWEEREIWERETELKENAEARREGVFNTQISKELREKLQERLKNGNT